MKKLRERTEPEDDAQFACAALAIETGLWLASLHLDAETHANAAAVLRKAIYAPLPERKPRRKGGRR